MTPTTTYVPVQSIETDLFQRGRLAAGIAADRLGLEAPGIAWIVPAPDGTPGGLTPDNYSSRLAAAEGGSLGGWVDRDRLDLIYVRADLPALAMVTAAHELRHIFQYVAGTQFTDPEAREQDAIAWAARLMAQPISTEEIQRWQPIR